MMSCDFLNNVSLWPIQFMMIGIALTTVLTQITPGRVGPTEEESKKASKIIIGIIGISIITSIIISIIIYFDLGSIKQLCDTDSMLFKLSLPFFTTLFLFLYLHSLSYISKKIAESPFWEWTIALALTSFAILITILFIFSI